jgi:hypothetical protein
VREEEDQNQKRIKNTRGAWLKYLNKRITNSTVYSSLLEVQVTTHGTVKGKPAMNY